MYYKGELPAAVDKENLDILVRAEPATIGHFITTGFMNPEIRAHFPDVRVAGTAVTVKMPGNDGGILHYAMGCARPGDFLVIDRCGERVTAALGGAMAYAARVAGVAGVIVDGYVTDLGELRRYGVPVWSRGASPVTTRVKGEEGEFCLPVSCGGVTVNPGDAIVADENGIVVLPANGFLELAQRAIAFQENEKNTLDRLSRGEKFPDIVGSRKVIQENLA